MSRTSDQALNDWLSAHHGVVTLSVLPELEMPKSTLYARARRGLFVLMATGVWRATSHPDDQSARMAAACLAHPEVTVGFTTAGHSLGLRDMRDPFVRVVVPHGMRLEIPGVVVHQTRQIDDRDRTMRGRDGVIFTTPPRTLLDAGALLGVSNTESAVEQAVRDGKTTIGTLVDTLDRLYHPHRPGAVVLRTVLVSRPAWRRTARSKLEIRVRQAIADLGLPEPDVNFKTVVRGRRVEFDLAWPAFRVALEVDHPYWHGLAAFEESDHQRDLKAMADGWYPCRVSESDVDFRLSESLADIAAVIAQRRAGAA